MIHSRSSLFVDPLARYPRSKSTCEELIKVELVRLQVLVKHLMQEGYKTRVSPYLRKLVSTPQLCSGVANKVVVVGVMKDS